MHCQPQLPNLGTTSLHGHCNLISSSQSVVLHELAHCLACSACGSPMHGAWFPLRCAGPNMRSSSRVVLSTKTLNPEPYTLHPTPYTLHPTPYTLHPTPYTLHPKQSSSRFPVTQNASSNVSRCVCFCVAGTGQPGRRGRRQSREHFTSGGRNEYRCGTRNSLLLAHLSLRAHTAQTCYECGTVAYAQRTCTSPSTLNPKTLHRKALIPKPVTLNPNTHWPSEPSKNVTC
jgi:hypothetical protein